VVGAVPKLEYRLTAADCRVRAIVLLPEKILFNTVGLVEMFRESGWRSSFPEADAGIPLVIQLRHPVVRKFTLEPADT